MTSMGYYKYMAHIVIDAREYTTSTGRYMFRLLQYLDKLDSPHKYTLLLKPHDIEVYQYANPNFTKVACPHKEFTFDEQIGLLKQIQGLQPDLVHFGKDHQPVLYKGKVVTTMHDLTTARFRNPAKPWLIFKFKQLVYKRVVRHVARKSDAILTPTQFVKDDMVRFSGANPAKITVTYESADRISDSPEAVSGLEATQFIMYVGRPTPHKNLGRLIDAFAQLHETHPNLHLVLAGKRDELYEQHAARASQLGLSDSVVFTGFVSEGQLRWLYEHCAAYVFPSLSEGFGLPALEAMIQGAPVVSSNATCLPEVCGEAAHYFDPMDVSDMARAIQDVLSDPALRKELIAIGKQQAAKYSWQRMAEQTLAIYDNTLKD
jgi:glycosyltransferase involved in cell wall biosynthesis